VTASATSTTTQGTCNREEEAYLLLANAPHSCLLTGGDAGAFLAVGALQLRGQEVAAPSPSTLTLVLANNKKEPAPMHLDPALGIPNWDPEVVGD
jgi:hypothetical protein